MRVTASLIILLVLAACSPVTQSTDAGMPSPPPANTPSPAVTELPTQPCGYQWAYQALPETGEQYRQAFDAAGMDGVTVRAEAFGENCVNADGSVQQFHAMQTDLYLAVDVNDLSPETIGSQVERLFRVVQEIPLEKLPGPGSASGYITFEFAAKSDKTTFRVQRPQIAAALDAGKSGASLYSALMP